MQVERIVEAKILKHIALDFLFISSHETIQQVKLKSSKLRMKSKCPDTCLITYGSCRCQRLLRQILCLDFRVNWMFAGLFHYTRLKTAIGVIESYTPLRTLMTRRSGAEAESHQFGAEFVLLWRTRSRIFCRISERVMASGRQKLACSILDNSKR